MTNSEARKIKRRRELLGRLDDYLAEKFTVLSPWAEEEIELEEHYYYCLVVAAIDGDTEAIREVKNYVLPYILTAKRAKLFRRIGNFYNLAMDSRL